MIPIQMGKILSSPFKKIALNRAYLRFKPKFTMKDTEGVSTSEIAEIRP